MRSSLPSQPPRQALALPALEAAHARYDEAVRHSADLDPFCSQHAFGLAAFLGLQPGRTLRALEVDGAGYLAFAERRIAMFDDPRPRLLWEPLEAMWGLCCPVVGGDAAALGAALASWLAAELEHPTVLLCGLRLRSLRVESLVGALARTHRLQQGTSTERYVASLEGGVDGFLSRRSARFRANLRRADRAGAALSHERHAPSSADEARGLYARASAIDDRSWKGKSEVGLRGSGLFDFYAELLPRLAPAGALRVYFLRAGEEDVAYLFGGIWGDTFRGLQFAFAAGHEAASLGNLAQLRAIASLCGEGVLRYDLGTAADYKRSWGEITDETASVIAVPRS